MDYEWDDAKAVTNARKHGVDFFEAILALQDPSRIEALDDAHDGTEDRYQIIGTSRGNVLFVVTTLRDTDTCRIISARKATRHEQVRYYTSDR